MAVSMSQGFRNMGLTAAAAFVIGMAACSFSSLDGLKNGQRLDGAFQPETTERVGGSSFASDAGASAPGTGGMGAGGAVVEPGSGGMGGEGGTGATPGSGGVSNTGGFVGGQAAAGVTGGGGAGGEPGMGGTGSSGGAVGGQSAGGSDETGAGGTGGLSGTGGARGGAGGSSTRGRTDSGSSRCAGVQDSGICWYFGDAGESCATTCALHGGNSPKAASHVGIASQGGSASECGRLLGLLGESGTVIPATRPEAEGLGCIVALGYRVWVATPAYSDNAKFPGVEIVCGCLE